MSIEVADVLDKAADRIETTGWIQGHLMVEGEDPDTSPVCLVGALRYVVFGAPNDTRPSDGLLRAAAKALPINMLALWNDEPGRTAAEVVAVLREAATRERAASAALDA